MSTDKRHEILGSEMEDFISHRTASNMNIIFVSFLLDPGPIGATQERTVDALQTLGFVTPEEVQVQEPEYF